MNTKISNKFLIAGFLIASIIALGTFFVIAQNGSNNIDFTNQNEITLTGVIGSVEDHGFTMVVGSDTYFVGMPYLFDKSVLDLTIGSEVTVTGYIVESPMMNFSTYPMFHATSINGVEIDHDAQMQSRSGNCGGNSGMGSNGPHHGGMHG
jgi:hypothetical protein